MRMPAPSAESAHRLGEVALLTTAFVLPLAFYLRAYDSASIKFAILQWGSLTMLFAWLWQGLSRGRFSAPASSWTALLPALAYGAWMIFRFATEPHKLAALPDFLTQLTMLAGFLAAFLGFAGARSAARFAVLVAAAGWLVAGYGLLQAAGLDPFVWKGAYGAGALGARAFSTLANPYLCASFLAVAVPLALTLDLDPETPAPLRAAALALVPVAGAAVLLTSSAVGAAAFCASCVLYGAIVSVVLRTPRAFKSGAIALLAAFIVGGSAVLTPGPGAPDASNPGDKYARRENWGYAAEFRRLTAGAELRMLAERPLAGFGPGSFFIQYPRFRPAEVIKMEDAHNSMTYFPELPLLGVAVELGAVGAVLWLWLFGAALWTAARGAAALRRAGALPESVYAAGFCGAAAGALAVAHFGWAGHAPAPGWYAWPLAGLAAGLAPLAARRAAVSVYPLPVSEDIRRALYAPSLLAFAGLAVMPGLWLRSDVNLNSGIYFAKHERNADRAVELFDKVLPGSPGYALALYFKGNALLNDARREEALAAYDELQKSAPDYALVHAQRGYAYAKMEDWKSAAAERRKQAELDPLYLENLIAWAEAARASGDLEQARLAAGKAVELDGNDERVKLQLAANDLMDRRLQQAAGRGKPNGRGTARKPK